MNKRTFLSIPLIFICMAIGGHYFPLILVMFCGVDAFAMLLAKPVTYAAYKQDNWPAWMDVAGYLFVLACIIAGAMRFLPEQHIAAALALVAQAAADFRLRLLSHSAAAAQ